MSKFVVEVKDCEWDNNKAEISVTHNGYQWTAIGSLTMAELAKIREAITAFLEKEK